MIEPTDRLISVFDTFNLSHAIFFVDTTYLIRLKEQAMSSHDAKEDFEKIAKQLQRLVKKKHYIFPHIHPHWIDAIYDAGKNTWKLSDISRYRFHAIAEPLRQELFDRSISILKEIIEPLDPGYTIDGYRAGGWCIQPFSDFIPHFKKHGIQFDFSVLPGIRNISNAQYYDFENAPSKAIYHFEEDVLIEKQSASFTQIAISVIEIPALYQFLDKLLLKYLWKTGNRSVGDGSGVVATKQDTAQVRTNKEMVSLELLNSVKLSLYKNLLEKKEMVHFISHPKMLSDHNFSCLKKYLKYASTRFEL